MAKSGDQDDDGSSGGVDTLTVVVIAIGILQQLAIGVAAVMYCQNRKSGAADEVKESVRAAMENPTYANAEGTGDVSINIAKSSDPSQDGEQFEGFGNPEATNALTL